MNIVEQLEGDLINALKERNERLTSLLRMLKSSLKNKEIEIQKPLDDNIAIEVLSREAKKRKESSLVFSQGGREDLAKQENEEYEMIKKYLPEEMSEEEIRKIIKETITESGISSQTDIGKLMGAVMGKLKGKADGGVINKIVKEELPK